MADLYFEDLRGSNPSGPVIRSIPPAKSWKKSSQKNMLTAARSGSAIQATTKKEKSLRRYRKSDTQETFRGVDLLTSYEKGKLILARNI